MNRPDTERAPSTFVAQVFAPGDWVAVLVRSRRCDRAMQRIRSVDRLLDPQFLAWLRAENAAGADVYVSVNAVDPTCRSRRRSAIAAVRNLVIDADAQLKDVLNRSCQLGLPEPTCLLHTSPGRGHVLWRVEGFTPDEAEGVQRVLAEELRTDPHATAASQLTRVPGFFNRKYEPPVRVCAWLASREHRWTPADFPSARPKRQAAARLSPRVTEFGRVERAKKYLTRVPPAIVGQHGDAHTFRVCCRLVRGFELSDADTMAVLQDWNRTCHPPWSDADLYRKVQRARKYGREAFGGLLQASSEPVLGSP